MRKIDISYSRSEYVSQLLFCSQHVDKMEYICSFKLWHIVTHYGVCLRLNYPMHDYYAHLEVHGNRVTIDVHYLMKYDMGILIKVTSFSPPPLPPMLILLIPLPLSGPSTLSSVEPLHHVRGPRRLAFTRQRTYF